MDQEIERCRREIAAIEAELLAGHPDLDGLLLALSDWSAELRILQRGSGGPMAKIRRRIDRLEEKEAGEPGVEGADER